MTDFDGGSAPLVKLTEIAKIALAQPSAVSNWRRRDPNFPRPVGGSESRPLFDREEVLAWLRANNKLQAGEIAAGTTADQIAQSVINAMRNDGISPSSLVDAAVAVFSRLPNATGAEFPGLADADGVDAAQVDRLVQTIAALIGSARPAEVFDAVLDQVVTKGMTRSEHLTSRRVADLMAAQLGSSPVIIDPAVGMGTLALAAAAATGAKRIVAYDINERALDVFRLRSALAGIEVAAEQRDILLDPVIPPVTASAVVLDPPFGLRLPKDAFAQDPRFLQSSAALRSGDSAWLVVASSHLAPDGTAVVRLPSAIASSEKEARVRSELIANGVVRSVIAVTAEQQGLGFTGLSADFWVLGAPTEDPSAKVRFVDAKAASLSVLSRLGPLLDADSSELGELGAQVADVSRLEIIRSGSVLAPHRWTGTRYDRNEAAANLERASRTLMGVRGAFNEGVGPIPALRFEVLPDRARMTTMRELLERKAARRVRPVLLSSNEVAALEFEGIDTLPIVFARGFDGAPDAARAERIPSTLVKEPLEAGDVMFVEVGERPRVQVWAATEPWAMGRGLLGYRLLTDEYLPEFVCAVFMSSIAAAYASAGSIPRRDFASVPIPALPVAEQRRIVESLGSLRSANRRLHSLAEDIGAAERNLIDAVAAGFATIPAPGHEAR